MRKMFSMLTIFVLAACFNTASAAMLNENFWINLQAGGGLNLGSSDRSELFPSVASFAGDLVYMKSDRFGLVPVSLTFDHYFLDDSRPELLMGKVNNLPETILSQNADIWEVKGRAWGVAYTPGVYFTNASDRLFNFFGQLGAGLYRSSEVLEVFTFGTETHHTDFAARLGGGAETSLGERANLLFRADYLWTNNDLAHNGLLNFSAGVRYRF